MESVGREKVGQLMNDGYKTKMERCFMKKRVLVVLCLLMIASQSVSAAVIRTTDREEISITGYTKEYQSNEVLISVFGPFDSLIDYGPASVRLDNFYMNAVYANEQSAYSFTYLPPESNKFYAVSVTNGGKQEMVTLYLPSAGIITNVLAAINHATSVGELKTVFDQAEYQNILIKNHPSYSALIGNTQRERVLAGIIAAKGSGFLSFEEFETSYMMATAIQSSNNCSEVSDIMSLAKTYLSLDGVSLYSRYALFSDDDKNLVFKRMMSRDFKDNSEYLKVFNESIFLALIQKESYSSNLTKLIADHAVLFGFNIDGYEMYANEVNQMISGNYYKTLADFQAALAKAISDIQNKKNTQTHSVGSGGSGSKDTPIIPTGNIQNQTNTETTTVFTDLESVLWAKEAILSLAEKKIISGKGDGLFYPQDIVTREEFVKMTVSAFVPQREERDVAFTDIEPEAWYYDYVVSAVGAGIISGMSETEFGTGLPITRQDIAAILYRVSLQRNIPLEADSGLFSDDDLIDPYAKTGVYALKKTGVISGAGENNFDAKRYATRAEAAKMINSMLEVLS